jgi:glycerol kinase
MFSALKARWLLDAHDPRRERSSAGELVLGTVDSWLLYSLAGELGIECGNASRTSLVDLSTGDWSPRLLDIFGIPREVLPRINASVGIIGAVRDFPPLRDSLPISGVLGDSHAALFAHAGWREGVAKATFGTGSSVMALAGQESGHDSGLCRTIAWQLPDRAPSIAWEANILAAGATVAWLSGILGCSPAELAEIAGPSAEGVVLVPAFNGLAAPWWDTDAQALLSGLSLSTGRAQLARAALDSIIFQVTDVIDEMRDAGCAPARLIADGGISANADVMRRQSAMCELSVAVSPVSEASALGAAHAAGLGSGIWSIEALETLPREYQEFTDDCFPELRSSLLHEWHQALALAHSR